MRQGGFCPLEGRSEPKLPLFHRECLHKLILFAKEIYDDGIWIAADITTHGRALYITKAHKAIFFAVYLGY